MTGEGDKVVIRFADGRVVKGYLRSFSEASPVVTILDADSGELRSAEIQELKAIFFVRSFVGDAEYHELKTYGVRRSRGHRIFIKFSDGEDMVGFLEGDVPWEKGFFLSKRSREGIGFYILPADRLSNNSRIFVIASAVRDVTVVP